MPRRYEPADLQTYTSIGSASRSPAISPVPTDGNGDPSYMLRYGERKSNTDLGDGIQALPPDYFETHDVDLYNHTGALAPNYNGQTVQTTPPPDPYMTAYSWEHNPSETSLPTYVSSNHTPTRQIRGAELDKETSYHGAWRFINGYSSGDNDAGRDGRPPSREEQSCRLGDGECFHNSGHSDQQASGRRERGASSPYSPQPSADADLEPTEGRASISHGNRHAVDHGTERTEIQISQRTRRSIPIRPGETASRNGLRSRRSRSAAGGIDLNTEARSGLNDGEAGLSNARSDAGPSSHRTLQSPTRRRKRWWRQRN